MSTQPYPRLVHRWLPPLLAAVLAATAASAPSTPDTTAVAADPMLFPVALTLPADATLARDAVRTVDDTPVPVEGPISLDDAIEEAYGAAATLAAADWDVGTLARSLGDDPEAAFRFLRDRIGFDAYPGALRGAEGTLAARGGNALDRALLLRALLDGMGLTARFAMADLDASTAEQVMARAQVDPPQPLPLAGDVALLPLDGDTIGRRARRDHALLRAALADRVPFSEPAPRVDAIQLVGGHAWVQVQVGDTWVDLDPTFLDATTGQPLVAASATADTLPAEVFQRLDIRLIAETLTDGAPQEATVLDHGLTAIEAADTVLFLFFQPESSGGGLLSGGGDPTSFVPGLVVGGETVLGEPFPIGDGAGGDDGGLGGFGGGLGGDDGGGEPAFVGLRLVVTVQAPGQAPIEATRILVDRAPAAERAVGLTDPGQLQPLAMTPDGPAAMLTIHHLMASTGGADPLLHTILRGAAAPVAAEQLAEPEALARSDLADILLPIAIADETIVVASERAIVPTLDAEPFARAWIGLPRVFVATYGPDPARPDAAVFATDLLIDGITVVVDDDARGGLAPRLQQWYGTLQAALETEYGIALARALTSDTRQAVSASLAMDQPLDVLDGDAAPPPGIPDAAAGALAQGLLVVVAGDPSTARAWWTIDPSSGATRAILDPGLGGYLNSGFGVKPTVDPSKVWEIPDYEKAQKYKELLARRRGCRGGTEYIAVVGCVSVPVATAITAVAVVLVVSGIGMGILWAFVSIHRRVRTRTSIERA